MDRPFLWGAATAAFQIEGAWDQDGKSASIWDTFARRRGRISTGETGDVTCDHYHRADDDIALMRELGLQAYRFSLSWPRLIPGGTGPINERGLSFYDRLVDRLLEAGIEPVSTFFHWDLPQSLQDRGGWSDRDMPAIFRDYVDTVYRRLSDRVRMVVTINEILTYAVIGNLFGIHAPGIRSPRATVRVVHNQLLGHALAYRSVKELRATAEVGIAHMFYPVYPARPRDRKAAQRGTDLTIRTYMDPLVFGRYPDSWRRLSRLFASGIDERELSSVQGTFDFIGLNHYTRFVVRRAPIPVLRMWPVSPDYDPVERTAMGWEVYPAAFGAVMQMLRREYGNPPVYVTENGAAFEDVVDSAQHQTVNDVQRVAYLRRYIEEMERQIGQGSDIRGYFVWSLIDNFEWSFGTSRRFGIVHCDFDTLQRTIKKSGRFYATVIRNNGVAGMASTE